MIEENINWAIKTDDDGTTLRRTDENGTVWWVPEAPGNRHYEEYLAWIDEGNKPEVVQPEVIND